MEEELARTQCDCANPNRSAQKHLNDATAASICIHQGQNHNASTHTKETRSYQGGEDSSHGTRVKTPVSQNVA